MNKLILWAAAIAVACAATACSDSVNSPSVPSSGQSGNSNPNSSNAATDAAVRAQLASACGLSQDGDGTISHGPGAPTGGDGGPSTSTGNEDGPGLTPGGPAPAGAQAVLAGQVSAVAGSCPALTLTLNATSVRTSAATSYPGGSCDSIRRSNRIGAVGTVQADGAVAASCVTGY